VTPLSPTSRLIITALADGPLTTSELTAKVWTKIPAEQAIRQCEYGRLHTRGNKRKWRPAPTRVVGETHGLERQMSGARRMIVASINSLKRSGRVRREGNLLLLGKDTPTIEH
jgi:hypothetical protein